MPQTKPLSWSLITLMVLCVLILTSKSSLSKTTKKGNQLSRPINEKWTW